MYKNMNFIDWVNRVEKLLKKEAKDKLDRSLPVKFFSKRLGEDYMKTWVILRPEETSDELTHYIPAPVSGYKRMGVSIENK